MKDTASEIICSAFAKARLFAGLVVGTGVALTAYSGNTMLNAQTPSLVPVRQGDQLFLRWPSDSGVGYVMEQSPDLKDPWIATAGTVQQIGDKFELEVDTSQSGSMFYRLRSSSFPLPSFMGLVHGYQGDPLANARVGERQLTDDEGIFSGSVQSSASGWIKVQAAGYATAYVEPSIRSGQTELVEAWMTPFGDRQELTAGGTAHLFLGDMSAPTVDVSVDSSAFAAAPLILELAELDPLDVGPLFVDLQPEADRHLAFAFALQAFEYDGTPSNLAEGSTLTVSVRDNNGTDPPPVLAWFDPAAGVWQTLQDACQRTGPGQLLCTLDRLSPLFGLFEPGDAPYLEIGEKGAADSSEEAAYDQAYKRDRARLNKRLKEIADLLEQGVTIDPAQDPEVQSILDDMAQRARDFASVNQSVQSISKLLVVAGHANQLGRGTLEQELTNEATAIANELALSLLSEGDCGRVREMLHAMEQLMLMKGDPALIEALQAKVEALFQDCDLWIGTIRFVSFRSSQHPGLDHLSVQSGGTWTEFHEIKMATHAKTHVLKGEDHVTLSFPEVTFLDTSESCENSISFYGDPAGASFFMNFDGTYDGNVFSVGDLTPAAGAQPTSITQRQLFQREDDGVCIDLPGYPAIYPFPNYYSVVMHGFLDSPPITVQEMLESGTRSDDPLGETISGWEKVSNEFPSPNFGRYPFTTGLITWTFIHRKKLLPLEP